MRKAPVPEAVRVNTGTAARANLAPSRFLLLIDPNITVLHECIGSILQYRCSSEYSRQKVCARLQVRTILVRLDFRCLFLTVSSLWPSQHCSSDFPLYLESLVTASIVLIRSITSFPVRSQFEKQTLHKTHLSVPPRLEPTNPRAKNTTLHPVRHLVSGYPP